jgi:hypothetical protein
MKQSEIASEQTPVMEGVEEEFPETVAQVDHLTTQENQVALEIQPTERPIHPDRASSPMEYEVPGRMKGSAECLAQIHCHKCKHVNPPTAWRCQNCDANLLPAESLGERVGLFVTFMAFAAVLTYLFYRFNIQYPGTAPDFVLCNTGALAVGAFLSFIMGFVRLLRTTPEYVRYEKRAERHIQLNAWQSLEDLNHAMDIAGEKEQAGLIKQRAKVYENLGLKEEAARDHLTLVTSPKAYKEEGAWVSAITGADAEVFSSGMRQSRIKAMLTSGKVKAVGYCKRCKAIVELNTDERCQVHPKAKAYEVEYVISSDMMAGKLAVMQKIEQRNKLIADEMTALIETKEAKAIGYCPRCKATVELNAQRRCSIHPRIKGQKAQYVVPGDEAAAKRVILRWRRLQQASGRQKSLIIFSLFFALLALLILVFPGEAEEIFIKLKQLLP